MTRAAILIITLMACGLMPNVAASETNRQQRRQNIQRNHAAATSENTKLSQPGDYRFSIEYGGHTRFYRVHVPKNYDATKPTPLLFALHGGGGNMDYQANDANYGLIRKSEETGFLVVFPNGYSRRANGALATWNAGNCCAAARDENIDDAGFIRRVFDNLTRQLNVDRERVYATGMSNGAMMSYRLACEASDIFRAIAPVAGTDNTRSCQPKRRVSVLHIHAKNDSHVLFNGGVGPGAPSKDLVTDFVSVPSTVAKWAKLNECAAPPERTMENAGAYCERYSCANRTEVQLCVTETGGHSWPGGNKERGSEPTSKAISANDVMWDFFRRH